MYHSYGTQEDVFYLNTQYSDGNKLGNDIQYFQPLLPSLCCMLLKVKHLLLHCTNEVIIATIG